jgi:RNA polymerase sigma factor (TIGR02999 family)
MGEHEQITQHLMAWRAGDKQALGLLTPLVYDELRRIAASLFRREADGHTLQPTALVHEAFPALLAADLSWQDRAHFFAAAARILRHVLIDHARAKQAQKRGGNLHFVTLSDVVDDNVSVNFKLLDLDRALQALHEQDDRKAEMFEMQAFGGLELEEIAEVMQVSVSTVQREIRFAKAWLTNRLGG